MASVEHLRTELHTYEAHKPALLSDEGKFVLIHGTQVAGVWDTYEDALQAGYQKLGLMPFLVKRIQRIERVQHLPR